MTEISVSSLGATKSATAATTSTDNSTLDKEAFLKLLVAQLKNQDPSSPMDTNALMAQTTQLSTMESLTSMNETSKDSFALQMRMAGASMVGKQVTWTDAEGTLAGSGTVSKVTYSAGTPMVTIGDTQVSLDQVSTVTA